MDTLDSQNVGSRQTIGMVLTAIVVSIILRRLFFNPLAKIPGPWYTNWTNIVLKIKVLKGDGPIYVDELHKQYGPVVRVGPNDVDVTDLTAVKKIHRVKADFLKTDFYKGVPYGKENLVSTQDTDFHRRHRKLLSQPISESSLKTMIPQIEEKVRLAIQRMGEEMKLKKVTDVFKWWMFMTTDVIGHLTFGESFHALEKGEVNTYIKDIRKAGIIGTFGTQLKLLMPILYYVPLPGLGGSLGAISDRMSSYASTQLNKLRDELNSSGEERPLLLNKLVKGGTIEGESMTEVELRNAAEAYIVAGSDTTSNTLTFLTWVLCGQPEIKDQLIKELQTLPANFTDDDLKLLPFLNRCITEALRRFPVVPGGLPRYVPKEGTEISGYWLPGGSTVTTQTWSLHRDPEIFPDPDRYDPSRWENPTKLMKDSMMPFGGGSRICIGMHLAYIELRMGLAYFFRAYPNARVSKLEGMSDDDMIPAMHFISSPRNHRCLIELS
ncbi:cytochrome P450 [Xylaria flabelliformis]|nr:cytochrome P450 [Xylaria flabelliformis]